jgi:subtilisin family serine protease
VDVVAPRSLLGGAAADRDAAGTSSSTAVAGGTAALVRAAAPSLSPVRVELLVRSSAVDVAPTGPDVAAGYGRLAPWRAVRRARALETRQRAANATAAGR